MSCSWIIFVFYMIKQLPHRLNIPDFWDWVGSGFFDANLKKEVEVVGLIVGVEARLLEEGVGSSDT